MKLIKASVLGILMFLLWQTSAAMILPGQGVANAAQLRSAPMVAALGASDTTLNEGQARFEENLKLSPSGGQYKGIEYSKRSVKQQPSDDEILQAIEAKISSRVVVAVSNGSVRLSGRLPNRAIAEKAVEQVKAIPGVHEVAFDLGLDEQGVDN